MYKSFSNFKCYWIIFLSLICSPLRAQQKDMKMDSIIIDSTYSSDLFNTDKNVKLVLHKFHKNTQTIDGQQSVSTITTSRDTAVIKYLKNSRVEDSTGLHYPFDYCISYYNQDTLMIEFRHHYYDRNVFGYRDRIIIHIIKNRFFSTYVWAKPPPNYSVNPSYSSLILKEQQLILKKPVAKIGDRMMGEIKVNFLNKNFNSKNKILSFNGPLDCIIK